MIRNSNSCCGNNAGLVDKFIGTAYDVVKTVYDNLGEIEYIYNFLNTYGMLLCVKSEDDLKALPLNANFARIYTTSALGVRQYTDYLYVEADLTGIRPTDPTATGSWIAVGTSSSSGGGTGGGSGGYIPYVYNNGTAMGGETTIVVPDGSVGVPFIIIEGYMQYVGYGFTFDTATRTVTLAQALEAGDEVVVLITGTPAVPDNPNVDNWTVINWLYNNGVAVGGEQVLNIPYTFEDVPAVYKNGLRFYKGLLTESYTIDAPNQRIVLTEPLTTNDRVIVQLGGELEVIEAQDRTVQEVARSSNVKDNEVILSVNTTTPLNGKKVIYDVTSQKIYGLPTLPSNVYIVSVSNGQLTYNPGAVVVDLIDNSTSASVLEQLADDTGATLVGTSTGDTVEQSLVNLNQAIANAIDEMKGVARRPLGERYWHDMRTVLPEGVVTLDGQELDQVGVYAPFYAELVAGRHPTCTEAEWQADPTKRGCYVLNSSTGKFRVPDDNGVQPGSLLGPVKRGDGGTLAAGSVQKSGVPNVTGDFTRITPSAGPMNVDGVASGILRRGAREATSPPTFFPSGSSGAGYPLEIDLSLGSNVYQTGLTEARMNSTVGVWVVQAVGRAYNVAGFDAEAVLARAESINADMLAKDTATNARIGYSLISVGAPYPALNTRTVFPNPFGNNVPIMCVCELFHATLQKWVTTPWLYGNTGNTFGATSAYSEGEGIALTIGANGYLSAKSGASQSGLSGDYFTASPMRIHVWKVTA